MIEPLIRVLLTDFSTVMLVAHNFAPGNAGSWFWTDVLVPLLLVICTVVVWRRQELRSS